jgi:cytidylate kinase
MLTKVKQESLCTSIAVVGRSGTGKELFTRTLTPLLLVHGFNTGMGIRVASLYGHKAGIFDDGDIPGTYRLRPKADKFIRGLLEHGTRGIHYVAFPLRADTMAHVFINNKDVSDAIRPRRNGSKEHRCIEMGAAAIAAEPGLRRLFCDLWRRTITDELDSCVVIGKNPDTFMPEAKVTFATKTDVCTAAKHRLAQQVAAFPTFEKEVAYLGARDALHELNGLDCLPTGAIVYDTTDALHEPEKMQLLAHDAVRELDKVTYARSSAVSAD